MDEKQSRKIALKLLVATSAEEVNAAMRIDSAFADKRNWRPYGGASKNWDRVGGQTSDPVGALGELIINSIDAILMRKAVEHDINPRSKSAPQSMTEAVKRFFPEIVEGKIITGMGATQRAALAEKSVLIGIKRAAGRKHYPTYTIADFGEGQNAADFHKTLLSLGENNKEGIPFVQGRFNMGSTGSIVFCTRSRILDGNYKFVLSKRSLPNSNGYWGWTLVKVRGPQPGEDLNVVEYFAPRGEIPRFQGSEIRAFGRDDIDIGVLNAGTIVKLYEYDIGPSARRVDFGLNDALTTNLLECALPVRIYDFDAAKSDESKLRQSGIAPRTFSGMRVVFAGGDNIDLPIYEVSDTDENPNIGVVRIYATGVKQLPKYLHTNTCPYRCFYTLNGQTQATERASFFNRCKLGDLENHLIVQVDCNAMTGIARSTIFKSDRERVSKNEFYRDLVALVQKALQEDRRLQEYAREIRNRRVREIIEETEKGHELWNLLVKDDPGLRELLGMGTVVDAESQGKSGEEKFVGQRFPTFLNLLKPGDGVLHLPVNTYRRIECQTDAANDYLGRELDSGKFVWRADNKELRRSHGGVRNGKFRVTVYPPSEAKVGESDKVALGFHDSSRHEPLLVRLEIRYTEAEQTKTVAPGERQGTRRGKQPALGVPPMDWVYKADWDDFGFDEESGGICRINDGVSIHVNADNKHLLLAVQREREESERTLVREMFRLAVGVLTLSLYKRFEAKLSEAENTEDYIKHASAAIAAHVVTLIQKLGRAKP